MNYATEIDPLYLEDTMYGALITDAIKRPQEYTGYYGMVYEVKPYEYVEARLELFTTEFIQVLDNTLKYQLLRKYGRASHSTDPKMVDITLPSGTVNILKSYPEGILPTAYETLDLGEHGRQFQADPHSTLRVLLPPSYMELAQLGPNRRFLFLAYFHLHFGA